MASSSESRNPTDHALSGRATSIPTTPATPYLSYGPMVIPAPKRQVDLQVKVNVPATGTNLPIILLSHGHGRSNYASSLYGYGPLVNFYASHGFVVIQPTHQTSLFLGLPGDTFSYWPSRAEDMSLIIDNLTTVEAEVPTLQGRLDKTRIAVVGHSFGGHTASMLCGMTTRESDDGPVIGQKEPRIKAGVLLTPTGNSDVTDWVKKNAPFMARCDFSTLDTPALVVVGDADTSAHLTPRGASWHADSYHLSPKGPKSLLTLSGAKHGLGGISGFDHKETDDEDIERSAVVQRLTWAYLWSRLCSEDTYWEEGCKALAKMEGMGTVESK